MNSKISFSVQMKSLLNLDRKIFWNQVSRKSGIFMDVSYNLMILASGPLWLGHCSYIVSWQDSPLRCQIASFSLCWIIKKKLGSQCSIAIAVVGLTRVPYSTKYHGMVHRLSKPQSKCNDHFEEVYLDMSCLKKIIWGHSRTTLTKLCPILTPHLPI